MTPNERKIIKCLWDKKGEAHVHVVSGACGLTSDYTRLLCRSLARAGYLKFEDANICRLLKKGRSRFENNDPVADEPMAAAANVAPLTDEPVIVSPASDRSDEEENQEEDASEDKDKDKPASSDEELDRALADLEPLFQKDESEEKDKPEESKDETELKPEPMAEEAKPAVAEAVAGKEKGLTEEAKVENPEKVTLKEEPAKPGGGFGASLKKIVPIAKLSRILDKVGINLFAGKK